MSTVVNTEGLFANSTVQYATHINIHIHTYIHTYIKIYRAL